MSKYSMCKNPNYLQKGLIRKGMAKLPMSITQMCLLLMCNTVTYADLQDGGISSVSDDGKLQTKSNVEVLFEQKLHCIQGKCTNCKDVVSYIKEQNPNLDMSQNVFYQQWVMRPRASADGERTILGKVRVCMTERMEQALGIIHLLYKELALHKFVHNWQAKQYEICKENLKPGEVLMVMDFAQSVQFEWQGEIQHAFFHRQSITLHPVICYFKCECGKTV